MTQFHSGMDLRICKLLAKSKLESRVGRKRGHQLQWQRQPTCLNRKGYRSGGSLFYKVGLPPIFLRIIVDELYTSDRVLSSFKLAISFGIIFSVWCNGYSSIFRNCPWLPCNEQVVSLSDRWKTRPIFDKSLAWMEPTRFPSADITGKPERELLFISLNATFVKELSGADTNSLKMRKRERQTRGNVVTISKSFKWEVQIFEVPRAFLAKNRKKSLWDKTPTSFPSPEISGMLDVTIRTTVKERVPMNWSYFGFARPTDKHGGQRAK